MANQRPGEQGGSQQRTRLTVSASLGFRGFGAPKHRRVRSAHACFVLGVHDSCISAVYHAMCPCTLLRTGRITLPAHKLALASASEYFRARLLRWSEEEQQTHAQQPQQQHPAVEASGAAPAGGQGGRELVEHCGPGELGAAEAVLRLMYTAQLQEEEVGDVDLLVKVGFVAGHTVDLHTS